MTASPWKRRGIMVLILLVALSLYDHWVLRSEVEMLRVIALTASVHAAVNSMNANDECQRPPPTF